MMVAYARPQSPGRLHGGFRPGDHQPGDRHAWADCTPIIALGGASRCFDWPRCIQRSSRFRCSNCAPNGPTAHDPRRIPELINRAFHEAMGGKPGPVISICRVTCFMRRSTRTSSMAGPGPKRAPCRKRRRSERDRRASQERQAAVIISGSVSFGPMRPMNCRVSSTPPAFRSTRPRKARCHSGDHDYCYLAARSTAFREADVILVLARA